LVGYRKVYSVRCEADVVMTSATPDYTNYALARGFVVGVYLPY